MAGFFDGQNCDEGKTFYILLLYSFIVDKVQRKPGETNTSLDENIWEFEWKRLEKHSKKILAPVILLGNNS